MTTELRCVREIEHEPFASQQRFYDLTSRFAGFSGPVGSGKSASLCVKALKLAYANPGLPGVIGAPTYTMLADVTRMEFLRILEENGIPSDFKKARNEVRLLEPNSLVRFRSLDGPTRLVGQNLAWFGLDELTYSKEDAWLRMLARLRHPKAKQLCGFAVWTPKGFDWVYNRFVGPDKLKGYEAVYAAPGENTSLAPGFYEALENSYSKPFYDQEVLGKYLAQFSGQIYFAFDRARNCRALDFDPNWPICWSLDFNIDPATSVISQVVDVSTREDFLRGKKVIEIRILDEIVIPDCKTAQHADAFLKRIDSWIDAGLRQIYLYGDATGNARQRQSNRSDWSVIKETLRVRDQRLNVTTRVPEANGPVKARTNMVNGALLSAANTSVLFIDPKCKELLKDFEQLAWPRDNAGNALDDEIPRGDPKRGHASDATGYLVVAETRGKSGPRTTVIL